MATHFYAIGFNTDTGLWTADVEGSLIGDHIVDDHGPRSLTVDDIEFETKARKQLTKIVEAVNLGLSLKQRVTE